MLKPTSIDLFTYRVGFGDCFLLRFTYPDRARHVLIDFGSTAAALPKVGSQMTDVAEKIREHCGGKLDAIVVTHRHRDHISGFAGDTWRIIKALQPELVLLPWTEDPDARPDAKTATTSHAGPRGAHSLRHVAALASMHRVSDAILKELALKGDRAAVEATRAEVALATGKPRVAGKPEAGAEVPDPAHEEGDDEESEWIPTTKPFSRAVSKRLAFLGEENLLNAAAVKNLMSFPREFLCFGSSTRLEKLLPGVKVHVLGPPTLEQSEEISTQRATDPDEFWHVSARALQGATAASSRPVFPGAEKLALSKLPIETRWFLKRLDALRGEELLELVRILDSAMNNTSLILLFDACGKKFLFPGDAQIENWQYALSKKEVRNLLADVDVYKVGHHGSLNATPKMLWGLFKKRGDGKALKTFLSTRSGKHGSSQKGTEVPRKKLVDTLEAETALFSTQDHRGKNDFVIEERIAP